MSKKVEDGLADHEAIDRAFAAAGERARLMDLRMNMKAPSWRNGKIVYVSPRRRRNGRKTNK
jgi:hypothetical protein